MTKAIKMSKRVPLLFGLHTDKHLCSVDDMVDYYSVITCVKVDSLAHHENIRAGDIAAYFTNRKALHISQT